MSPPTISAAICTRDRGALVTDTIKSILASAHSSFELIVIDQSDEDDTERAIEPFLSDKRVQYVRPGSLGLSQARNEAMSVAAADVVAFTDDDCTVPPDWLTTLERSLDEHPSAAVAFCSVEAGPHDETAGFVPQYVVENRSVIRSPLGLRRARVMGAGMAVRRDAVLAMGGFDQRVGAGAALESAEDRDIALRALWHGYQVVETDAVAVVHHGFRTWSEGRELARRDWVGLGAVCAKALRKRDRAGALLVMYEVAVFGVLPGLKDLVKGRRPRGLGRVLYALRGTKAGLREPLDARTLAYEPFEPCARRTHWKTAGGLAFQG